MSKARQINFEQAVYDAFGQVKDFTLAVRIARYFYEKAEKDLSLTWEDMLAIHKISYDVAVEYRTKEMSAPVHAPFKFTAEEINSEILRRFNESKQSK